MYWIAQLNKVEIEIIITICKMLQIYLEIIFNNWYYGGRKNNGGLITSVDTLFACI